MAPTDDTHETHATPLLALARLALRHAGHALDGLEARDAAQRAHARTRLEEARRLPTDTDAARRLVALATQSALARVEDEPRAHVTGVARLERATQRVDDAVRLLGDDTPQRDPPEARGARARGDAPTFSERVARAQRAAAAEVAHDEAERLLLHAVRECAEVCLALRPPDAQTHLAPAKRLDVLPALAALEKRAVSLDLDLDDPQRLGAHTRGWIETYFQSFAPDDADIAPAHAARDRMNRARANRSRSIPHSSATCA